jgi:hypothetical protein
VHYITSSYLGRAATSYWEEYMDVRGTEYRQVKVHPRTGHQGPEEKLRYSSTLSLTTALNGVGGQRHASAALPPGKRPDTHCTRGWLGGLQDRSGRVR